MRRVTWVAAIVLCFTVVLTGCGLGKKDAGSVVKDLDQVVKKMDSYQGVGRMVLHTASQPQEYQVEVWYQNPNFYRIALTNEKKDITQIVLRNNEGVFVLTPHLNKSFRFQSDWPQNQGQVYLYQSLVNSIVSDNARQFTTEGNAFVFDVLANYQNNSTLARQKIWLDKKNYAPRQVQVSDASSNVMVEVNFSEFQFNKKFDKDSFDTQKNMAGMQQPGSDRSTSEKGGKDKEPSGQQKPGASPSADAAERQKETSGGTGAGGAGQAEPPKKAEPGKSDPAQAGPAGKSPAGKSPAASAAPSPAVNATPSPAPSGAQMLSPTAGASPSQPGVKPTPAPDKTGGKTTGASQENSNAAVKAGDAQPQAAKSFGLIEPGYKPAGVQQQDVNDMMLGDDPAVIIRYTGTYHYTLVESQPQDRAVFALPGRALDLGYTLGFLTGDEKRTLIWSYDGVEYRLSSADLPNDEMVKIAQAVQGGAGK